ncbi:MAG: glycosyl transferase family 1 [Flavobacteria bacterium RIFCSPLOWO2_12_FULL_31_7]|nr:MAG: glycosyl transferase family 1 [Flavobacteria bacterium RIFCSPLOWO2_12_FULL_31_7]
MKIGILGTRGIPNNYGGFEQFAEFFATYAANAGHDVFVYTPHNHPYKEIIFEKVHLIKCNDPEHKIGTAGQFIYDLNCILDSRKRNFDIILQLGYTSSAFWYDLHPKNSIVITNMDGLEWKRTKYSKSVQKVLKIAEKLAAKKSDYLISDSLGIQDYLLKTHHKESEYIAYGAHNFDSPSEEILNIYQVEKYNFNMIMARFEPENNLDMVLDGVMQSKDETPILVIGNHNTKYGEYLKNKFSICKKIQFLGAIYNLNHLDNLRYFSNLYFHGHTVGGTNPSLLEAMASQALVVAHNNHFNKGVLKENAYYFESAEEVKKILETIKKNDNLQFVKNNFEAIATKFNWNKINEEYLQFFNQCLERNSRGATVK